MTDLLAGTRVLDLGTRIGAPFAATLLADFGAEVIKVELPGQGDFMRTIGPFVGDYSLFWAVEGRGKKSITCDLRKPAGQALLKRLVPLTDVVVENFQPGTLESWGLGYEVLAGLNPGLILTRVSVYGQSGPYRDRPGLDRNGIALGGLLYITGYPDRPPVRPGLIVSDYLTGVFNAFAIMAALWERERRARETGAAPRGQWVDLSLYESILRIMEHTLAAYDRLGMVREREGNRLRNSAPLDNWETNDGKYVCIIAAGDGLFPRLARAMGREDLLADPRFTTMARRAEHGDEINGIVAAWCRQRTAREIQDVLEKHDVPFGIAASVADIFADPHVAARGDIVTVEDPTIGPVACRASTRASRARRAPSPRARPGSGRTTRRCTAACSACRRTSWRRSGGTA
jgi:crotonobetainyl-CoA:carnitine CoA-transferase CaiB-like acyl-CoA transferase